MVVEFEASKQASNINNHPELLITSTSQVRKVCLVKQGNILIMQDKMNSAKFEGTRSSNDPCDPQKTAPNIPYKDANTELKCRLCGAQGHSMLGCQKYNSYQLRLHRAKFLGLCILCASNRHTEYHCPGKMNEIKYPCKICKIKKHFTALCPYFIPRDKLRSLERSCHY